MMRSRKAVTSGIIEPPKPRLRTGSPGKSSFSDVHIRMLELPVKMMPPFGGGSAMSSTSKAWMSASYCEGSGPFAAAGAGAGACAGARNNARSSSGRRIRPLSRRGDQFATEPRRHGGRLVPSRHGDAEKTEETAFLTPRGRTPQETRRRPSDDARSHGEGGDLLGSPRSHGIRRSTPRSLGEGEICLDRRGDSEAHATENTEDCLFPDAAETRRHGDTEGETQARLRNATIR